MDLLKNKKQYFTPEELAVKKTAGEGKTVEKIDNKLDEDAIVDLEMYQDRDGLTVKNMDAGFWFIKNKRRFVFASTVLLGTLGVFFWGYFLSVFGAYFAFGMKQDSEIINRIIQSVFPGHEYFINSGPKNLNIGNVKVFSATTGKYDFSVVVNNPNYNYFSNIEYIFSSGDRIIDKGNTVILPNVDKYVLALGKNLNWRPEEVNFQITSLRWLRVDPHKYGNWNDYFKNHLAGITVSNIDIEPSNQSVLSEKLNLNSVAFDVANNTGFNYAEAGFIILLSNGNNLQSVHRYVVENFDSGIKKGIDIVFPGYFSNLDNIEVIPDINIIDDNIFSKFRGKGFVK